MSQWLEVINLPDLTLNNSVGFVSEDSIIEQSLDVENFFPLRFKPYYKTSRGTYKAVVSNSVLYAGHILTKKGSRAALRGKMSPQAAIGG